VQSLLEPVHVDLVLLDLDGSMETGFQFLGTCRASARPTRILVLTSGLTPLSILRALQLRVAGIFLKARGLDALLTAIRMVTAGEAWLEPDAIRLLAAGVREPAIPSEDDVLQGVLDGLTNLEIAARTGLPENVVKSELHRLFRKAGVRTRGELIRAHGTRSHP
jgi:two-component system response regulator NreC